jgi:histidyl-tRNA synthetase
MNTVLRIERRKTKNAKIRLLIEEAQKNCNEFFQDEYHYNDKEAVEELGLDSELIDQLVEDYVIQIIKSVETFKNLLLELQEQNANSEELQFTPFRELVHKNLGVARNLRIKDSEKILTTLMKSDHLDELETLLRTLEFCAIKLKPVSAYGALELLEIKSKLN